MSSQPLIRIETYRFPPATPYSPTFALQITSLTDSYMLWVGIVPRSDGEGQEGPASVKLARDWACAMPGRAPTLPPVGTSLFRAAGEDLALPLSQRLARRFKKQIFLSVDLGEYAGGLGGEGGRLIMEVEKRIVETLDRVEKAGTA